MAPTIDSNTAQHLEPGVERDAPLSHVRRQLLQPSDQGGNSSVSTPAAPAANGQPRPDGAASNTQHCAALAPGMLWHSLFHHLTPHPRAGSRSPGAAAHDSGSSGSSIHGACWVSCGNQCDTAPSIEQMEACLEQALDKMGAQGQLPASSASMPSALALHEQLSHLLTTIANTPISSSSGGSGGSNNSSSAAVMQMVLTGSAAAPADSSHPTTSVRTPSGAPPSTSISASSDPNGSGGGWGSLCEAVDALLGQGAVIQANTHALELSLGDGPVGLSGARLPTSHKAAGKLELPPSSSPSALASAKSPVAQPPPAPPPSPAVAAAAAKGATGSTAGITAASARKVAKKAATPLTESPLPQAGAASMDTTPVTLTSPTDELMQRVKGAITQALAATRIQMDPVLLQQYALPLQTRATTAISADAHQQAISKLTTACDAEAAKAAALAEQLKECKAHMSSFQNKQQDLQATLDTAVKELTAARKQLADKQQRQAQNSMPSPVAAGTPSSKGQGKQQGAAEAAAAAARIKGLERELRNVREESKRRLLRIEQQQAQLKAAQQEGARLRVEAAKANAKAACPAEQKEGGDPLQQQLKDQGAQLQQLQQQLASATAPAHTQGTAGQRKQLQQQVAQHQEQLARQAAAHAAELAALREQYEVQLAAQREQHLRHTEYLERRYDAPYNAFGISGWPNAPPTPAGRAAAAQEAAGPPCTFAAAAFAAVTAAAASPLRITQDEVLPAPFPQRQLSSRLSGGGVAYTPGGVAGAGGGGSGSGSAAGGGSTVDNHDRYPSEEQQAASGERTPLAASHQAKLLQDANTRAAPPAYAASMPSPAAAAAAAQSPAPPAAAAAAAAAYTPVPAAAAAAPGDSAGDPLQQLREAAQARLPLGSDAASVVMQAATSASSTPAPEQKLEVQQRIVCDYIARLMFDPNHRWALEKWLKQLGAMSKGCGVPSMPAEYLMAAAKELAGARGGSGGSGSAAGGVAPFGAQAQGSNGSRTGVPLTPSPALMPFYGQLALLPDLLVTALLGFCLGQVTGQDLARLRSWGGAAAAQGSAVQHP